MTTWATIPSHRLSHVPDYDYEGGYNDVYAVALCGRTLLHYKVVQGDTRSIKRCPTCYNRSKTRNA